MVVLIIIMAVMSSVIVPAFSRLRDRASFDTRIGQIIAFLSEARARAMELGTDVELRYDEQSASFTAYGQTVLSSADMPTELAETSETAVAAYQRTFVIPSDFRVGDVTAFGPELNTGVLSGPQVVVRFHPDGTCDGLRFTIVRETGEAAVLTMWPTTGAIDVEAPSGY